MIMLSAGIAASVMNDQTIALLQEALEKADQEPESGNKEQSFELGNQLHELVLDVAGNQKVLGNME
ncbi:hypothetical protein PN4B1_48840 [Paenibacillus naphthalenovorans]|nr:hypothetical protein PN4B1_48840 [Paenibacillus naphthalenovorans]